MLTKQPKYSIALWMVEQEKYEFSKIPFKAVEEITGLSCGEDNETISCAINHWKNRNQIINSYKPNRKMNKYV